MFDVNLRAPYYDPKYIFQLLNHTNLLKLNFNELNLILDWLGKNKKDSVNPIFDNFPISEIILTSGVEGATYYNKDSSYFCPALSVNVVDSVGSGDSFLAAFLSQRLTGKTIETSMTAAAVLSAYVTSKHGPCPKHISQDLSSLWQKSGELKIIKQRGKFCNGSRKFCF